MSAAIDMAESGHLVIGTLHTKSCAETLDRIINFYEFSDQAQIKYLMAALLKIIVSTPSWKFNESPATPTSFCTIIDFFVLCLYSTGASSVNIFLF